MLTWDFNMFAAFLFLNVEAAKCALRSAIPQFLIIRVILKAWDHIFRVSFKYFFVLILGVKSSLKIRPEYGSISATCKNDVVIESRIKRRYWLLVKIWSLSLSRSEFRSYGLYTSPCTDVPNFYHAVLASWEKNSAILRKAKLLDKICMLTLKYHGFYRFALLFNSEVIKADLIIGEGTC